MTKKKIMVVDDLHLVCAVIADIIQNSPLGDSCSLTSCYDEASAIEQITNDDVPYDLVIVDLQLDPERQRGGIEVALAAKNRAFAETKVIIMTGARNVDLDGIVSGCKADGYVLKPFHNFEMLGAIIECLAETSATA